MNWRITSFIVIILAYTGYFISCFSELSDTTLGIIIPSIATIIAALVGAYYIVHTTNINLKHAEDRDKKQFLLHEKVIGFKKVMETYYSEKNVNVVLFSTPEACKDFIKMSYPIKGFIHWIPNLFERHLRKTANLLDKYCPIFTITNNLRKELGVEGEIEHSDLFKMALLSDWETISKVPTIGGSGPLSPTQAFSEVVNGTFSAFEVSVRKKYPFLKDDEVIDLWNLVSKKVYYNLSEAIFSMIPIEKIGAFKAQFHDPHIVGKNTFANWYHSQVIGFEGSIRRKHPSFKKETDQLVYNSVRLAMQLIDKTDL